MHVPAADPRLAWFGALSLEERDDGRKPWRLPHERRAFFPSPGSSLLGCAACPAGVRVGLLTDSRHVAVELDACDGRRPVDLCIDGALPDDLHPSHEGYAVMAERFQARVAEPIFAARAAV